MNCFTEKEYKELWKKDTKNDDYLISPKAFPADIKRIEEKLGYKIPESYKTLMDARNGGKLKKSFFQLKDSNGRLLKILRCESLYGIWDDDEHSCLLNKYHNKIENGQIVSRYEFEKEGFEIGSWVPDSGWGCCFFYLDYSICGPWGEPRVSAYVMKWSPIHNKAIPINYIVAETFELFIKGLIGRPAAPSFDFALLKDELFEAAKKAVELFLKNHPQEQMVSFGFYTNYDGSMIGVSMNTGQHLQNNIAQNPRDQNFYTFSTAEWKYEGTYDGDVCSHFTNRLEDHVALLLTDSAIRSFRNQIIDCCVNVLSALQKEGFFTEIFGREIILMAGTCEGDIPKARFKQIIQLLNPKAYCPQGLHKL